MKKKQYFYGSTYKEAFERIGVIYNEYYYNKIIKPLEREGYNERGICYAICKSEDKLSAFSGDRLYSVIKNEVRKIAFKRKDTRWGDYWKNKTRK